ncbi:hypothetical protein J3D43_000434 [Paenibacillus xylanexedens]|uniref:SIR2 family NAD-dependent protein deacylase n=1 Tax=Paenibacillus xylanexedens TaxID=528191 RepID=UPI0020A00B39|nr:SIR2 family protein [Paenibacillus xylanexedens]MCP1421918.1 hypothetical protein [Paenibacillus xylanexedens]
MSLEQLINAVAEDFKLDYSESLDIMRSLAEVVGYSNFSKRTLYENFSKSEVQIILKNMNDFGYLNQNIHYYCPFDNGESITSIDDKRCELCDGSIEDEEHEVTEMYIVNEQLIELIRKANQNVEFKAYLNTAYKKNLKYILNDKNDLIPFLGSGVSMPLGLPNWQGLLVKLNDNSFSNEHLEEEFNILVKNGDLLTAFDFLKGNSFEYSNYDQVKERIIEIIAEMRIRNVNEVEHNYNDLVALNSNFYLTTNYDLYMSEFLTYENEEYTAPICLSEINSIRKLMTGNNQVIHLHGHLNKKDTMIVSREDYQNLYANVELMMRFGSIMNNKPLLFVGFSFNDDFFKELFEKIITLVSSQHYIIIPNADNELVRKFNEKNIKVISLNVKQDSQGNLDSIDLVKAIKVLITFLIDNDNDLIPF